REDLVIITSCYPYSGGEQFLYREFKELENYYRRIIIFPLNKSGDYQVKLGDNVFVDDELQLGAASFSGRKMLKTFLRLRIIFHELLKNEKVLNQIKDIRRNMSYLKQNLIRTQIFR